MEYGYAKLAKSNFEEFRARLRSLYISSARNACYVQFAIAIMDFTIILIFLGKPYFDDKYPTAFANIEIAIALVVSWDLLARAIISRNAKTFGLKATTWIDFAIITTLFFPDIFSDFTFLRLMRIWSFSRSTASNYLLKKFGLERWRAIINAVTNLATFLLVTTGFIYNWFFREAGQSFLDALYFTVTTVTTTGFGDVTLSGGFGKIVSIATMIFGVSLFLRLAQAVTRPEKLLIECSACGLSRHDLQAIHCQSCGALLKYHHDDYST